MTNLQHYATKAYYVEQDGCYDPKIVQLKVDSEQFMLELYEALYAFMATGKAVEDDARIDVFGVSVLLSSVLKEEYGAYNYKIKDLNIFDLKFIEPAQVGQSAEKLFFLSHRSYLPDTEDDFEIEFYPIVCKDKKDFENEFKKACEKNVKKGEYLFEFYGLYFHAEDVYHVDRNGKLDIFYPSLTEVV